MNGRPWIELEIAFLESTYRDLTDNLIAHALKRTIHSIHAKRKKHGLKRRAWTESELDFLQENSLDYTDRQLSEMPQLKRRSPGAIQVRRYGLGISKRIPKHLASKYTEHTWAQKDFPAPLGYCLLCEIKSTCPHCGEIDYSKAKEASERARIDHSNLLYQKRLVLPMCVSHNSLHSFNGFVVLFEEVGE